MLKEIREALGRLFGWQSVSPQATAAKAAVKIDSVAEQELLGKIKKIIAAMDVSGDDTLQRNANLMHTNLPHLAKITNSTFVAPERDVVLAWLEKNKITTGSPASIYLTFTEHLAIVAHTFAKIREVTKPYLAELARDVDNAVNANTFILTMQACKEIGWEVGAAQGQSK